MHASLVNSIVSSQDIEAISHIHTEDAASILSDPLPFRLVLPESTYRAYPDARALAVASISIIMK
jgi:hypothetical protein